MARPKMSDAAKQEAAHQAAIRTIRGGERPFYRVVAAQDGSWSVLGCPWLPIAANDRRSAVDATRAAVAAWLAVEPDVFDVESA
jgi:hypothetical protein